MLHTRKLAQRHTVNLYTCELVPPASETLALQRAPGTLSASSAPLSAVGTLKERLCGRVTPPLPTLGPQASSLHAATAGQRQKH